MKAAQLVRLAAEAVEETQRELPPDIMEVARQVPVRFEPRPGPDLLAEGLEPDLLGLFTGSPLGYDPSAEDPMPPQIFLYTANLWDFAERDAEAYRDEARLTYLHELGHFLGWDEDQVAARGLD